MSDLLALLHTNSPLSLIHRYLDIQTIDSAEISEKLQKTLVDIDDDKPPRKGKLFSTRKNANCKLERK